jgi:hypothetical protein
MPLITGKSKKSFGKNVSTEMHAGKPQDQAVAIAYSKKREAEHMHEGGSPTVERILANHINKMAMGGSCYSEGGMVANGGDDDVDMLAGSDPANFDDLALRDDLTSTYGEDDNAGDALGDAQETSDREDMISRIMRQRKMKQTNPRPA